MSLDGEIMSNQKSFSFSYKKNNLTKNEEENSENKDVQFDAHINVWNVADKKSGSFIDFGLLITNYKQIASICFTAPFEISEENVEDLSKCIHEKEIQLIFNNSSYIYTQINNVYTGYKRGENDTVLILPIKNNKNKFLKCCTFENASNEDFSIEIDLSNLNDIPTGINTIYIRYRIKNIASQEMLSTLATKNNYLESAFTERQILDFKLNNVRTMNQFALSDLKKQGYVLTKFKSIHLFVMVPSTYEISTWGDFSECRQLETDEWNTYLNNNISMDTKNILAYHWKQKYDYGKDKFVDEFAQLIKIEHKSTNIKMIFIYCIIVVFLGALGSASFEAIKVLISMLPK